MSLDEGFALSDTFILSVLIRASTDTRNIHGATRPLVATVGGEIPVYMEVFCYPMNWRGDSQKCNALEGKLCGIYERRPQVCRLVPFDMQLAPQYISRSLMFEEPLAKKLDFECDWSAEAPLIANEDGFVDPNYAESLRVAAETLSRSHSYLNCVPDEYVHSLVEASLSDPDVEATLPITEFIFFTLGNGFIDEAKAIEVLENQICLINQQETEAIRRKDQREKPITDFIRQARASYIDALERLENIDELTRLAAEAGLDLTKPPIPEDGRWADWQDAHWGNLFEIMGWEVTYTGGPHIEDYSFFTEEGRQPIVIVTIEEEARVDIDLDDGEYLDYDFRRMSTSNSVLVLPIEPVRWSVDGKSVPFLGWFLPYTPNADAEWLPVFVSANAKSLVSLLDYAVESGGDAPPRVGTKFMSKVREAEEAARAEGYQRIYTRRLIQNMMEEEFDS